ncbi:MAG: GAF domain-containing protein, partial [Deltaproteobacteria bacterium]|nr:GAF domain-containing protein [Deltaproteobacteria bacterium]
MKAFSHHLTRDALLPLIIAEITRAMEADRSTLFLLDEKTGELWSKVAQGDEIAEIRFAKNLGIAGHVATSGETLNIKDAYSDPRFNPEVDRRTGYHTQTI